METRERTVGSSDMPQNPKEQKCPPEPLLTLNRRHLLPQIRPFFFQVKLSTTRAATDNQDF